MGQPPDGSPGSTSYVRLDGSHNLEAEMKRTLKAMTLTAAPALLAAGVLAACDDDGSTETAGGPRVAVTAPAPSAQASSCDDTRSDELNPAEDQFLPGSRRVPVR
jgi:hypothetical protein